MSCGSSSRLLRDAAKLANYTCRNELPAQPQALKPLGVALRPDDGFERSALGQEGIDQTGVKARGIVGRRSGGRRVNPGGGSYKKIGINPMHYPLIKCPSGARQAAPQFMDLDTPRRPVAKYKINLLYWN